MNGQIKYIIFTRSIDRVVLKEEIKNRFLTISLKPNANSYMAD